MPLAQISQPPQRLPKLPQGPSLDHVRGPVEMVTSDGHWQIAIGILSLILLLAVIARFIFFRKLKYTQSEMSPYEVALAKLDAASTCTRQNNEHFAVLCSRTLRHYLENRLGFEWAGQTSEELLSHLKSHISLEDNHEDELKQVLSLLDRIKFARETIGIQQRSDLLNAVRTLLKQLNEATQMKGQAE